DPADGSAAAATLARALDRQALLVAAGGLLPHGPGAHPPGPRCLGPLCRLAGAVPVLRLELVPGERRELAWPLGWDGPLVLLAGVDGSVECPDAALLAWALPLPTPAERSQGWRRHKVAPGLAATLARELRQGPSRIAAVGATATLLAELAGRRRPGAADLGQAAQETARGLLEALAQPVSSPIDEAAFVAPTALRAELDLLLARCRARDGLEEGLGPAVAARWQPGVRALFSGPSGTGKTLAAAWLAGRLGLPLWRVDLAAVTSKWIGETEKNLAVLLARAEAADVVLLFDEADALFGRRTDIKDSNDRFANAQTNWLLQRIETYEGIVLLTSNSRARFDPAFTRRLDMVVEFDPPAMAERRSLWRAHLGPALDPRALDRLAALPDLTGGQIRSAVLAAAARARSRAAPLTLADLGQAAAAEYRKQGRAPPPELEGLAGRTGPARDG
ncbi:MAG TPA: ATP-binding protein, partial [Geminicoccaceae bacterium]|nr:ATP-binding protein [Geminicoccaceae bacterium]